MKIAVVDDNESERTKLCTLLREWGEKRKYEMVCNEFTDGKDFLKASGTYQAVFLDIYMEKLNGKSRSICSDCHKSCVSQRKKACETDKNRNAKRSNQINARQCCHTTPI